MVYKVGLVLLFLGSILAVLVNFFVVFYTERLNINVPDGDDDKIGNKLIASDKFEHLFWFIQVSDLHFSIYYDPDRISDFEKFCLLMRDVIKPKVVLVTGDLTDAKTPDLIDSKQFIKEWNNYKDIIHRTKVAKDIPWLDIRGNHDNFNVLSVNSSSNYFRTHSVQGKEHAGSYSFILKNGGETYNFVAVDACVRTGLKRPFNFVGVIDQEKYSWLEKQAGRKGFNGTVWFGHYTSSTILSPYPGIRNLMRNGLGYFCGHMHTLHGWVNQMQTLHSNGLLELELGDWKDHRLFRVAAIDHNVLSFVDVKLNQWPIILVTNPKNAVHSSPNSKFQVKSSHIRILVFSPYNVSQVTVSIDGGPKQTATLVKHPLYVLPWKPQSYASGLHTLQVYAKDGKMNKRHETVTFSTDGSRPSSSLGGRLLLRSHISWFQLLFSLEILTLTAALVCLRHLHLIPVLSQFSRSWPFIRYLHLTTKINSLYWPLVAMTIYPAIGPWFIGYLSEDRLGIVFAWAIYINGNFIPGSLAYFYGALQCVLFMVPLIAGVSQCVKYRILRNSTDTSCSLVGYLKRHIMTIAAIFYQSRIVLSFIISYGSISAILSFSQSWYVIFAIALWLRASNLPHIAF